MSRNYDEAGPGPHVLSLVFLQVPPLGDPRQDFSYTGIIMAADVHAKGTLHILKRSSGETYFLRRRHLQKTTESIRHRKCLGMQTGVHEARSWNAGRFTWTH